MTTGYNPSDPTTKLDIEDESTVVLYYTNK